MDALRSGIRRLVAGARRGGQTGRSVDIVDPHNVAVSINSGPHGGASSVSSRQTVVSRNGNTRVSTTRSSQETQSSSTKGEDHERSN